jgi:hypothetical protein
MHYNQGHLIELLYILIPIVGIGVWIYSLLWQDSYYKKQPEKAKPKRRAIVRQAFY